MTFRKEGFSMGIGAIMAYQPYIYNTNTVSAKSLEKIQGVNNDVSKRNPLMLQMWRILFPMERLLILPVF